MSAPESDEFDDLFRVSQRLAASGRRAERNRRPPAYLSGWLRSDRLVGRLVSTRRRDRRMTMRAEFERAWSAAE